MKQMVRTSQIYRRKVGGSEIPEIAVLRALGHSYALDDLEDGGAAHHEDEQGQQPGTHL